MMQPIGAQGYPQSAQAPSASAVNIQIFEPKAYGGGGIQQAACPTCYSYPQGSFYSPQPSMGPFQPFIPQQQVAPPVFPQSPVYRPAQALPQQQMPAPVLNSVVVQPQDQPAPEAQDKTKETELAKENAPVSQEQTTEQVAPKLEVVSPTEENQTQVDVDALVKGLQSTDNKTQEDTITQIANYSQGEPQMQAAVLTEPIMMGLANIVKQDTSNLQGPSDAQRNAIDKYAAGEALTPDEQALVENPAPKTLADKNRVIAMFALALLQRNQRDEVDKYNATQNPEDQLPQLAISDLKGYNEIENVIRSDATTEKEVKLAGIQALGYVARPEDKAILEPLLSYALQDSVPLIRQTASEVLKNIGSTLGEEAQTQTQEANPPKLSRRERRAQRRAQKA